MHKSVRLLFLGLSILGLLAINCHKSTRNALRILSINTDKAIIVDIVDNWSYTDAEGDLVEMATTPDVIVPIELAYTEQGSGLPTWPGPYTARITKYTITFKDVTSGIEEISIGEAVRGSCNFSLTADPDMKNTVTQEVNIMPMDWILLNLGDLIGEDPPVEMILKATIRFDGLDDISGNEVTVSCDVTINAADYLDNPDKQGS